MKQIVNVGIGGRSFAIDNDAYARLGSYLQQFRLKLSMGGSQTNDVMNDLEERIAELFTEKLGTFKNVVDITLVDMVIARLGMPDGSQFDANCTGGSYSQFCGGAQAPFGAKKFYRDTDNKSIGGVCSGLAIYFGMDLSLVKMIFVVCAIMGLASFWIYVILWIIAPQAETPQQKCEMRGLPLTDENLRRFTKK